MNKKILSALLLTALGASTSSMAAFTSGNFTGTAAFQGEITSLEAENKWQWTAGDAITLDSKTSDLTSNGTIATIAALKNTVLLVGQTSAVSIGSTTVALNPEIKLTNADGTAVTIDFSKAAANDGKGVLKLKVMPETGTDALGEIALAVKAGAIGFSGQTTATNPTINTASLLSSSTVAGAILKGALPDTATAALTETAAATWLTTLGATATKATLLEDYNTKQAFSPTKTATSVAAKTLDMTANNVYVGAVYGLGVATGDKHTITFTKPVTEDTSWKSSLNVSITYI